MARPALHSALLVLLVLQLAVPATRAAAVAAPPAGGPPRPLPPASPEKLPRWRGFNLLEKFQAAGHRPFVEKDFALIARLGFNFVRLPMDYRAWVRDGDWERLDERVLRDVDDAVAWGGRYGVHVCVNFHRAPGYTVAKPPEPRNLWTDPEAQRVCALHWAAFARRYKGVPNERLSFNLFNEPGGATPEQFVAVVRLVAEAIRREDPGRLIIADGLEWGLAPVPELKPLRVAQATRGYAPVEVSHYKASWMEHLADGPVPEWPGREPDPIPGTLSAPGTPARKVGLAIDGPFPAATALRLRVDQVSNAARLVVEADGRPVFERAFKNGPGEGEWKRAVFAERYGVYQNVYDRDYTADVPAGAGRVTVRVADGDWLTLSQVGLRAAGASREDVLRLAAAYGRPPPAFRYAPAAAGGPFVGLPVRGRAWHWDTAVEPWKRTANQGVGVFVGEWGAYNRTPHDVVLRWAEDCLANWERAGFGWALWNFRGPFGVLDSGRADVRYEDFEGHKLDRALLELLRRY